MSKTPETFGGLTREQIRWDAEHQPDHLTNCAAAMVALLDALERAERDAARRKDFKTAAPERE